MMVLTLFQVQKNYTIEADVKEGIQVQELSYFISNLCIQSWT